MKHAANRSKSTDKAKAKTLTQIKVVTRTKPVTKKPISKVALNSRRQTSVQKTKAVVKAAPKNSTRVAKPTVKKTVPKLSAKTLNALKTISARKAKPIAKQTEQPKAKKVTLKTSVKAIKTPALKRKLVSPAKKVEAVEKKIKKTVAAQTAKSRQPKVENTVPTKLKSVRKKVKPISATKKPVNIGKRKPIVTAKTAKRKRLTPTVSIEKVNQKSKKIQPLVSAKKIGKKTDKVKPIVTIKKVGRKTQKLKPAVSAATVKKRNSEIKKVGLVEKIKTIENVIEAKPRPLKPKNKKARPISSAVFRGKKEQYDFKVFALNEKFEPIPAVYIISKRKMDKRKKGHHALICIGETVSISDEIKRHRKGKCVKKHAANVISILPEADEKTRLKIETDLKAAHTVACNLN